MDAFSQYGPPAHEITYTVHVFLHGVFTTEKYKLKGSYILHFHYGICLIAPAFKVNLECFGYPVPSSCPQQMALKREMNLKKMMTVWAEWVGLSLPRTSNLPSLQLLVWWERWQGIMSQVKTYILSLAIYNHLIQLDSLNGLGTLRVGPAHMKHSPFPSCCLWANASVMLYLLAGAKRVRCEPVSQCWTQHSKLYCGCKSGQLLAIDVDTGRVNMLVNPKTEEQRERTDTLSMLNRGHTSDSLHAAPIEEENEGKDRNSW